MPVQAWPGSDSCRCGPAETLSRLATGVLDPGTASASSTPLPRSLGDGTIALLRLAALVASRASAGSYRPVVRAALENHGTAEDVLGTVVAIAPVVGMSRLVAATTGVALALGYDVEHALESPP